MRSLRLLPFLLIFAITANAATFVVGTDRDLVLNARAVVSGTALSSFSRTNESGAIETITTIRVDEAVRAEFETGAVIEVVEPGGTVDGLTLVIPGVPRFASGERVLLFLDRAHDNWVVRNFALGKFSLRQDLGGKELLLRDSSEIWGWTVDGRPHREPYRAAAQFMKFVRETARGGNPKADYFVPKTLIRAADALRQETNASVTSYLIQEGGTGFRRANFPTPLVFRSNGSQPGATNGGVSAAQLALAVWTSDGSSNIVYQYGGTTTVRQALSGLDGVNAIIFNDLSSEIPGAFSNADGGTLAIGGFFGTSATHTFGGETFVSIGEVGLVIQNGISGPGLTGNGFDHVLAHELGHTLGFRHSDEPPAGGTFALDSLMTSFVDFNDDPTGASLQSWDLEAVATVYGSGAPGGGGGGGGGGGNPPPVCVPPAITTQPVSSIAGDGASVTLSVQASGTAPLSYQWYQGSTGDTRLPLAAGPVLTVAPSSTTSYWVRVTGACTPFADSQTSTVTVKGCSAITVSSRPQSVSVVEGTTVTLAIAASAPEQLSYQWFVGDIGDTSRPIASTTSITVTPLASTSYWVRVTSSCGATQTAAATVSVRPCTKPSVLIQPASSQVVSGTSAALASTITGTVPVLFQWYEGIVGDTSRPVSGATTASVTTQALFTPTSFWLRATNECGAIDTQAAAISIVSSCTAPAIVTPPLDQKVTPGSVAILSIGVSGSSLSYRWYEGQFGDRTKPLDVSGPSVATRPIDQSTPFWVEVTSPCGRVSSNTITVSPADPRRRAAGK